MQQAAQSRGYKTNPERCNSIGQVLGLLLRGHQFESHKY
jgi:hypothetical protein